MSKQNLEYNLEMVEPRAWHAKAVEMSLQGKSSSDIAEALLGRRTQGSTVRDFLRKIGLSKAATEEEKTELKILYWDIETLPSVSAHWGQWGQNISKGKKIREGHMLSHAWAWGDGEVHSSILTPQEVINADDSRIVYEMWSLFDQADVIVAHNGRKFDIKKAKTSFILHGLVPPSPYKVIDTLSIAKRNFSFPFNNLDYLCDILGVEFRKVENSGERLWMSCLAGDPESLKLMQEYNEGDIPTLRALYKKLRAWDTDGVNLGLFVEGEDKCLCPNCASDNLEKIGGKTAKTPNNVYDVYRCKDCKAISRSVTSISGSKNNLVKVV